MLHHGRIRHVPEEPGQRSSRRPHVGMKRIRTPSCRILQYPPRLSNRHLLGRPNERYPGRKFVPNSKVLMGQEHLTRMYGMVPLFFSARTRVQLMPLLLELLLLLSTSIESDTSPHRAPQKRQGPFKKWILLLSFALSSVIRSNLASFSQSSLCV